MEIKQKACIIRHNDYIISHTGIVSVSCNNIIFMLMDLSKVKNMYPLFLGMLRERGYSKSTVNCYQWTIKRFLDEAQAQEIFSWEDCHANLAKKLSPSSRVQAKSYLYIFRYYVENGRHPKDLSSKVKYLPINSYRLLNPYYKQLVDNCRAVSLSTDTNWFSIYHSVDMCSK